MHTHLQTHTNTNINKIKPTTTCIKILLVVPIASNIEINHIFAKVRFETNDVKYLVTKINWDIKM